MFHCLPKVKEKSKKRQKKFHLTRVKLRGGEAKMESGNTFPRFFSEPFPYNQPLNWLHLAYRDKGLKAKLNPFQIQN